MSYTAEEGTQHVRRIPGFAWADDLVLFADKEKDLQELVSQVSVISKELNLSINADKSIVIIFGKNPSKRKLNIRLGGSRIPQKEVVTYLGYTLHSQELYKKQLYGQTDKYKKVI